MFSFFIGIITHPAFNIVTALLGCLFGFYLGGIRDRRKDHSVAAKAFYVAFLPMLQNFPEQQSVKNLFLKQFRTQKEAQGIFSFHLGGKDRARFNKIWQEYENKYHELLRTDDIDIIFYNENKKMQQLNKEVYGLLEKLISFAK